MSPTLFGVLWVPLVTVFAWKPVRLLQLAVFGSIFQGAAIAQQGSGFDSVAIAPSLLPAALFVGHGLLRLAARPTTPLDRRIIRLMLPLLLLAIYAVLGSFLLPRLFEGDVKVWPPRAEQSEIVAQPLAPARGNITQASYAVLHVGLAISAALLLVSSPRAQMLLVRTFMFSGFVVLALCIWELASHVGVPFPDAFLQSNKSISNMAGSSMGGVFRVSGPFTEASFLAMFLSGTLFASAFLVLDDMGEWKVYLLGLGSLLMILLSTSTTGLVATMLLLLLLLALPVMRGRLPGLRRIGLTVAVLGSCGLVLAMALPLVAPQVVDTVQNVAEATTRKQQSESFDVRSRQDMDSLQAPLQTLGLGAGWGSIRASSFLTTLVGNAGVPGLLLCLWSGLTVTRCVIRMKQLPLTYQTRFVRAATSGMLLGNLVAAVIAVPDLDSWSFFALLGTLAASIAGATSEYEQNSRGHLLSIADIRVPPGRQTPQPKGDPSVPA